jgi:hypothetical protein
MAAEVSSRAQSLRRAVRRRGPAFQMLRSLLPGSLSPGKPPDCEPSAVSAGDGLAIRTASSTSSTCSVSLSSS